MGAIRLNNSDNLIFSICYSEYTITICIAKAFNRFHANRRWYNTNLKACNYRLWITPMESYIVTLLKLWITVEFCIFCNICKFTRNYFVGTNCYITLKCAYCLAENRDLISFGCYCQVRQGFDGVSLRNEIRYSGVGSIPSVAPSSEPKRRSSRAATFSSVRDLV